MGLFREGRNKERFVEKGLEYLTKDDSDYKHFFRGADGSRLSEDVYRERKSLLEESLEETYENKVSDRMKLGFSGYLSSGLRGIALANYGIGGTMFALMPGPAGFGFTGLGVVASTLADAVDSNYYHKAGLVKGFSSKDVLVTGEATLEKAAGYFPGLGLIDLYRGRRKFDNSAISGFVKDEDLANYTISRFANKLYQNDGEKNMIKLQSLRDPNYLPELETSTAA